MKKVLIICIILIFIILAIITYLHISKKTDEKNQINSIVNQVQILDEEEEKANQEKDFHTGEETFEAQIQRIDLENEKITIIQMNNGALLKDRSFELGITDEIRLHKNGNQIVLSDFQVKDKVLVTYDGFVELVNPPTMSNVYAIELLENRE